MDASFDHFEGEQDERTGQVHPMEASKPSSCQRWLLNVVARYEGLMLVATAGAR
jgi:hypothetical protein